MTITHPAQPEDIPGIQALAKAALQQQQSEQAAARTLARIYSAESLQRALANQGATILVATRAGKIVGFCKFGSPLFDDCLDRKEIHTLLVLPSVPASAEVLLEDVESQLRDDPVVQRVSVYVDPSDSSKQALYRKRGYQHRPREDKDGLWYYEKSL